MRALVKSKPEVGLWMERVPVPEVGAHDVLIKIKKSAICGTDVHIWNWDEWSQKVVPIPLVTGHEFVGEIVELGSAVQNFTIGQRVSGEGHITCGHCRNCRAGEGHLCHNTLGVGVQRAGSFAEYLALPQQNVVPIPDDIPDEILKDRDQSKAIPPLYGALLKNEQDVHLLERLAFMHRRESR